MKELKIIKQQEVLGKDFKVYGDFENPLFLAKDVAEWIEHSDVSTMLRNIDSDEKLIQTIFVSGQNREAWFLTEDGLYEVLMQSRKPIAKQFKKKVKEILKEIRKTGQYSSQKKDSYMIEDPIERAKRWIEEQKEKLALQAENEQMKPKAEYFDDLVDRNLLTNFRDTAKELHIKQKEFITFLIERKYIYRDTHGKLKPSASSEGLFELKEYTKSNHSGTQTLVTPKGRETFRLLLRKGA